MHPDSITVLMLTEVSYQSLLLTIEFLLEKAATIRCEKTGAEKMSFNTKTITIFSSCYYKNSS